MYIHLFSFIFYNVRASFIILFYHVIETPTFFCARALFDILFSLGFARDSARFVENTTEISTAQRVYFSSTLVLIVSVLIVYASRNALAHAERVKLHGLERKIAIHRAADSRADILIVRSA